MGPEELLRELYTAPLGKLRRQLARLREAVASVSERARRELEVYEEPVCGVEEFIESPLYLNLAGQVRPKVKQALVELFSGGYREGVLCWGIGSGKSFLASLALAYMVYRTLCLRNPQAYYGLSEGSSIAFMNVSVNAKQAKDVVFGEVRRRVEGSPWFQSRYKPQARVTSELRFAKGVTVIPGNSSENCPLGYNLLGAVMDEAAFFPEGSEGSAAEEVYNALLRRIASRFGEQGLLLVISSPRCVGDFVERKLAEARREERIYAQRMPLWEALPGEKLSGECFHDEVCGPVPVEFKREFERDLDRARRDLGAVPSRATTAWLRDMEALEAMFGAEVSPEEAPGALRADFVAADDKPRFIHIDLGLKKDGCGIAMAHMEPTGEEEPRAVVDLAVKWKATEGEEIQLREVRQLVYELSARGFAIGKVTFDQFQSADSRQQLASRGYRVELQSVDRTMEAYEALRELIHERRIECHRQEELKRELSELEVHEGRKVDHPVKGSKDLADAVAGAVWTALRAERSLGVVVY